MSKISFLLTIFFCIFIICFNYIKADEFVDIKIDPKFRDVLISNPFLMDGNIEVVKINRKKYLIAVEQTEISVSLGEAKRIAEILAIRKMAAFILGEEVFSIQTYDSNTSKSKILNTEEQTKVKSEIKKKLEDHIEISVRGKIPGSEIVGYWLSEDKRRIFVAVALKF